MQGWQLMSCLNGAHAKHPQVGYEMLAPDLELLATELEIDLEG